LPFPGREPPPPVSGAELGGGVEVLAEALAGGVIGSGAGAGAGAGSGLGLGLGFGFGRGFGRGRCGGELGADRFVVGEAAGLTARDASSTWLARTTTRRTRRWRAGAATTTGRSRMSPFVSGASRMIVCVAEGSTAARQR